jgi:hypothetical protein
MLTVFVLKVMGFMGHDTAWFEWEILQLFGVLLSPVLGYIK